MSSLPRKIWLYGWLCLACTACDTLPGRATHSVAGANVEYARLGERKPAILFENGLGADMSTWRKVFAELGQRYTVVAHNRPGYGDSSPLPGMRDGATIIDEYRALLRDQGIAPPYILVGHSLGGLYMQLFARRYPQEVAGMVLVDSSHPRQLEGAGAVANWPWWARASTLLWTEAAEREFAAVAETGEAVLRQPLSVDMPIIILSATEKPTSDLSRFIMMKKTDLARLYPGSCQIWLDSGHFIQLDHPLAVVDAVQAVANHQYPLSCR